MNEAQAYYEDLLAQGYTPEQATKYTQEHYSDYAAIAPTPQPMAAGSVTRKSPEESIGFASKTLPLIVILFVSAAAFGAGFYSNSTNGKAESARQEADMMMSAADKMDANANKIIDYDLSRDQISYQLLDDAFNLHLQYLAIEGSDMNQEQYLMDQIHYNLFVLNEYTMGTYSYYIDDIFLFTEDEFINLAFLEDDGYDYQLLKSDWNNIEETYLVDVTNTSQFMINYGFDEYWVDNTFENYQPVNGFAAGSEVMFVNFANLGDVLNLPIDEVRLYASDKNTEADEYEGETRYIASAVSVTAVAAVLTTQMAARIKAKENINRINQLRYDILKDDAVLNNKVDFVSLLVLALAAVLTGVGLAMAFL